ncbi:MAG: tRNA (adenosine(37)-N6)-threonylcarbamoyltransferase complex dimerization subunit type 1 TsaB [Planctomycetes bacterium]|nr:tRNA (adenosine(37)-N6)-threonylcarbamoyltransferase complex dimerization subunit type 1 TsaB [Planctomycetota bacterium]
MHILALETTERAASLAALDGSQVLLAKRLDPKRRSAQTLISGISELLQEVGWRPADIQLIGLTIGPGSFTGLRVGVTAAKTLAYATGAEVLGLNTLEVIAAQSSSDSAAVWAVLDAQRSQVYAARFGRDGDRLVQVRETKIEDIEAWLASVQPEVSVSGPILSVLADRLPPGTRVPIPEQWAPQAEHVGRIAFQHYMLGERQNLWQLVPHYYRQSAAEEKLAQRDSAPLNVSLPRA